MDNIKDNSYYIEKIAEDNCFQINDQLRFEKERI